eukprot:Skav222051  [mRNA]  locus=scaffold1020:518662:520062:+ [translate_table: standard]
MSSSSSKDVYVAAAGHSYVSQSGIVALLRSVKEHGLPEAISRPSLKRSREKAMMQQTPLGPLYTTIALACEDNETIHVPVANPLPLLWVTLQDNQAFSEWFWSVIDRQGICSTRPFRVIIYADEILPGDQLKATNSRKLVAFYWSVLEFDGQLGREDVWMHTFVLRTMHVKRVLGGYSQILRKICDLFVTPPNDLRLGVGLPGLDGTKFVFGKVAVVLGDEAALKQLWSNKGSSGTFCCMFCQNVVNHLLGLAEHDSTGRLISSCSPSLHSAVLHTDRSVIDAARHLANEMPRLRKGAFEDLEKQLGLTWVEHGALWDHTFLARFGGPISMTSFDWMHCYLVNGLFNSEASSLLTVLQSEHGIGQKELVAFMKSLCLPRKVAGRAISGIRPLEKHTSGALSCSASEGLSLYPIIRSFLSMNVPAPTWTTAAKSAVDSFNCLAAALDMLVKSRSEQVSAQDTLIQTT